MSTPTLQLEQLPKLKDYQDRLGTKLVRDPSQTKPVMDAVLELIDQVENKGITVTGDDVVRVGVVFILIALMSWAGGSAIAWARLHDRVV